MRVHDDDLAFRALDGHSWRLCDTTVAPRDAGSVVAYVELTDRGYEVVWLRGPAVATMFPSLDAVMRRARRTVSAS